MIPKIRTVLWAASLAALSLSSFAPLAAVAQSAAGGQEPDPLKRQRSDKERFEAQKAVRQELKGAYKTWLNQDVVYIITDEEKKAFSHLANDEERDAFIEQFWLRRNPDPNSPDNAFREEHYRRIAYANEHYAAGKPGWKTDRGRIYISWGAPDSIDSHPSGGSYNRPMDEGGGTTSTYPFETWHYRSLEGVGDNIDLEFVDSCQCGDYRFTVDRGEKDALKHVPGSGSTLYEQQGSASRTDRLRGDVEQIGAGPGAGAASQKFDRLLLASKVMAPPPIQFKDMDSFLTEHKILRGPPFPFDVRTDFLKVTESSVLVPITLGIRNRDITYVTREGVSKGVVNILGKVTTLTHRTVQVFEDTVQVSQPAELLEKSLDNQSVYWKALPLLPGLYRLDIILKDVNNPDHIGLYGRSLNVPVYQEEKLSTSSLILADTMRSVSTREIGSGNFVLGDTYVRPRLSPNPASPVKFKRDQPFNFWMQVYNLGIDEATRKNRAKVAYQITAADGDASLLGKTLDSAELGAHGDQLTVAQSLPITALTPGKYKLTVTVSDGLTKQEAVLSAQFLVE